MSQTLEPTATVPTKIPTGIPSEISTDPATGGWDDPTAPPVGPQPTPRARVEAWLSAFEAALAARDPRRAASHFATQSLWRDLVAFTRNLTGVRLGRPKDPGPWEGEQRNMWMPTQQENV